MYIRSLPRLPRRHNHVEIAATTGPLDIIRDKRVLVIADAQNLDCRAHNLGYRLSWSALGVILDFAAARSSRHAVLATPSTDHPRLRFLEERGWTPRAKRAGGARHGRDRNANADVSLAVAAGLLASRGRWDVVLLGSGDGDLVEDVAEAILSFPSPRSIATLSLAGSTSQRLDCRVSPLISDNLEIGLDFLKRSGQR